MRKFAALLLLILTSTVFAQAQSAEDIKLCDDSSNPDQSVIHCTAEIESGQVSAADLPVVYYSRGNAYFNKGDYDHAMQDYSEAIRLGPESAYGYLVRGEVFNRKHDYARAIQDFDQSIRLDPRNPLAFLRRGNAYSGLHEIDRAIKDYDQTVRINPAYSSAFNNLGNAYSSKGDLDEAIRCYDQALRITPSYVRALNGRAQAHIKKDDFDGAIQDLSEAIRLDPTSAESFNDLGFAFGLKGETDRAIQSYDQAIRLDPTDALAFSNRSESYTIKGDYVRALQDLDQAILLSSDSDLLVKRGRVRFYLGQFVAAQSDFSTAMERTPSIYSAIWLYLAESRNRQNGRHSDLEKHAAGLDHKTWPGPVADLYLGHLTSEQLLSAANASNERENRQQHSAAYFYLGEHALLAGHGREARKLFKKSIQTGVGMLFEYTAAQTELDRLNRRSIWRRILRLGNAHPSQVPPSATARTNGSG